MKNTFVLNINFYFIFTKLFHKVQESNETIKASDRQSEHRKKIKT